MSKVRNISGGDLDVPLLDRVVAAGEVVEVPDFQPAHTPEDPAPIVWPPDKWEPVADAPEPAALEADAPEPEPLMAVVIPPPEPEPAAAGAVSSDPRER